MTATIAGGPTTKLVASGTWMLTERLGSQSALGTRLDTLANEISSGRACHVGL